MGRVLEGFVIGLLAAYVGVGTICEWIRGMVMFVRSLI